MLYEKLERKILSEMSFSTIISSLSLNKAAKVILLQKWQMLAHELETGDAEIMELENDMTLKRKDIMGVVHWLLIDWRSRTGRSKATIDNLIEIVSKLGMEPVVEVFENLSVLR